MSAEVLDSNKSVTLNEGQGHSIWNQNTEFTIFYHYTKFERIVQQLSACKPMLTAFFIFIFAFLSASFFFLKSKHISGILSLEYRSD